MLIDNFISQKSWPEESCLKEFSLSNLFAAMAHIIQVFFKLEGKPFLFLLSKSSFLLSSFSPFSLLFLLSIFFFSFRSSFSPPLPLSHFSLSLIIIIIIIIIIMTALTKTINRKCNTIENHTFTRNDKQHFNKI